MDINTLRKRIALSTTPRIEMPIPDVAALLDVAEAAATMDYVWDKLDRCIEAGFAAEERPDIARARVIRAAQGLRSALAALKLGSK